MLQPLPCRSPNRIWCFLIVWVLAGYRSPAGANTDVINFEDMTLRSSTIAVAVCLTSTSRWDESSRTIVTDSVFRVIQHVKGGGGQTLRITSPGGALPERNLIMTVPGMAAYTPGEEAVLFLTARREGSYTVYGTGRGKLSIQRDAAGVRRVRGQRLDSLVTEIHRILQTGRRNP